MSLSPCCSLYAVESRDPSPCGCPMSHPHIPASSVPLPLLPWVVPERGVRTPNVRYLAFSMIGIDLRPEAAAG
jgi:hypothetical protein